MYGWEVTAVKFPTVLCAALLPWSLPAAAGVLGSGDL